MRVAVFVDAGYVYAQGSSAITGLKTPKSREALLLNETKIVEVLKLKARLVSSGKELLRIYWYDAAPLTGPTAGQIRIGQLDDVKLRLGQLNSTGQQKGVDSLIVTDLMELARNKVIVDAVVVTGDEDIRVGVQIAQSLGVRVHVLGIDGPRSSQSLSLLQEADTVEVWNKSQVSTFLKLVEATKSAPVQKTAAEKIKPPVKVAKTKPSVDAHKLTADHIEGAIDRVVGKLRIDSTAFNKAIKLAAEGKQLPGPIVSDLKAELQKIYYKNPTKAEQKLARDAMTKRMKEHSDAN
jgi:uncharacterized LabA/DUF88 family protein